MAVSPFSISQPMRLPRAMTKPDCPEKNVLHLLLQTHDTTLAENLYLYLPDKYMEWLKPNIIQEITQISKDKALLNLSSDALVKDLKIEIGNTAKLSDNYIDLLPGKQKQIEMQFEGFSEKTSQQIKLISVTSEFNR